jgi:hypothetical protein
MSPNTIKKFSSGLLIALLAAAVLLLYWKIGCPFRALTGIPCPGCGMTRSFLSLFHLDFHDAFLYHPMFPAFLLLPILLLIHLARHRAARKRQGLPPGAANLNAAIGAFFTNRSIFVLLILTFAAFLLLYLLRVLLPLIGLGDPFYLRLLTAEGGESGIFTRLGS